MSPVDRLTLTIPRELADAIQAAIDAGDYASPSELAEEALATWVSQRQLEQQDLAALKAAYEEGKASGPPRRFDVEPLIRRARRRFSAAKRG